MPIVMVDPQRELVAHISYLWVGCSPELCQDGALCSLDLSVQVWRAWRDRPEPHGLIHQAALDAFGKEFGAPIRLEPLDRERHLLQHLVEKRQGRMGRSASCEAGHKE